MPGQINFPEKLAADIDTPPTGYAAIYVNTSGAFAIKDDAGNSTTVQGVTDGDKGDITVSSSGATWTIDNSAVTLAKIANIATDRLLGRDTASSGVVEELTVGGGIEFTGSGGIQRSALTGDVTATAGSGSTTIANDAVTYAKMQNVSAASRLLGRGSAAGSGDVQEISLGTGLSMSGTTINASGVAGWTTILTHDFAVTPQSTLECDVTGYTEIHISGYNLVHAAAIQRNLQFSIDGGSTWYTTSGDYADVSTSGALTNNAAIFTHNTNATAARSFFAHIYDNIGRIPVSINCVTRATQQVFIASATAVNRIRLMGSASGSGTPSASNFTAGTVIFRGRT